MADSNQAECEYEWTRVSDDTVVRLEFSQYAGGVEEDENPKPFQHEGYQKLPPGREVKIINLTCAGTLSVNRDDPSYSCNFTVNPPTDESGE